MKSSKRSKNLSLEGLPLNAQHRTLKIVCGADLLGERKRHEKNEHGADTKRNGDANNAEVQLNDVFAPKGPINPVPFPQTLPAAGGGRMLGNEYWMPLPMRPTVIILSKSDCSIFAPLNPPIDINTATVKCFTNSSLR
jgi:hypothetical protein